ncbi:hypothetical protein BLAT2472_30170 [Burkholderia latens]
MRWSSKGAFAPGDQYRKRDRCVPITDSQIVIVAAHYGNGRAEAATLVHRLRCASAASSGLPCQVVCYPKEYRYENRSVCRPAARC